MLVELVHSKLNFVSQKNIFKHFQKEDKLDILIETIYLLEIEVILTRI